jgi:hypothetical protein
MVRSVAPVSRVSVGVPVTVTLALKVTCIEMDCPTLNVPLAVEEVTFETVGAVQDVDPSKVLPSILTFDEPARDVAALVAGNARFAELPTASVIVPPESDDVAR